MEHIQRIHELSVELLDEVISIRRHLHAHPELSFEEVATAKFVASKLSEFGIPYVKGVAGTGLVATVEGKNPRKNLVALRADLDALSITEANDVEYKSQNEGVMHACGHDVHTSSLLGAARILHELKDDWEGTVRFIFQPGEEHLPGGAPKMIEEGVLENPVPKCIVGQHVYPELEAGKIGLKAGMYMASNDEIYVTVKGRGGHAALPHKNVDPVLITSHIVVSLQQIVSRYSKPDIPSVLSFGKVKAEGATNVIPDEVYMEGTFRTMDEDWRTLAHQKMKSMAETIAESMGGSCDFRIEKGYPYLVNDKDTTRRVKEHAVDFLGAENVIDLELRMTAEDFAYYAQKVPACFYRLGVRNESRGITSGLHTSTFDVDEDSLKTGMGLMAWIAINELKS